LFKWSTLPQRDAISVLATIEGSGLCTPSTSSTSPAQITGERGKEDSVIPKSESVLPRDKGLVSKTRSQGLCPSPGLWKYWILKAPVISPRRDSICLPDR